MYNSDYTLQILAMYLQEKRFFFSLKVDNGKALSLSYDFDFKIVLQELTDGLQHFTPETALAQNLGSNLAQVY